MCSEFLWFQMVSGIVPPLMTQRAFRYVLVLPQEFSWQNGSDVCQDLIKLFILPSVREAIQSNIEKLTNWPSDKCHLNFVSGKAVLVLLPIPAASGVENLICLYKVPDRFSSWHMKIKFKHIIISHRGCVGSPLNSLVLNDISLEHVPEFKYLGVWMTEKLSWLHQIEVISKQA